MLNKLVNLSRFNKQLIMFFVDVIALILIILASFSIRLGFWYFPNSDFIFWLLVSAPIIGGIIFQYFGLYRSVTRYVGINTLWIIVQAVSLYALVWGVIFLGGHGIPRSVILINWILSIVIVVSLRMSARWLLTKEKFSNRKRAIIYGAGDAGIQLASALSHSSEYELLAYIDDAKGLQGNHILGLKVYPSNVIGNLINRLRVDEVLIAMPSVSRIRKFNIINSLEPYPVTVRMLPGVAELAEGKLSVDDLRTVNIKDLLGRDAALPNQELLGKNITNKSVVVTGAGGSIGSEICRQVISLKPKMLIMYEISESSLYTIEKELADDSTNLINIYPVLGSVNNKNRLNNVFEHFGVDTVYHAAAYKHVPMVEFNNTEGVDNNIFGTLNCAQAAIDCSVETFVLISTDKAVRPTNTMGATKRCAELVLQALSEKQKGTKFTMVRFGNVLDSSGSVIPLFKQQIKEGGPITVTDKRITRYFMMISEAVELVIQAGAMGQGGDVFVLDMGKSLSIDVMAKKMIKLSGLEVKNESNPDGDIEIKYTGLRPGEKLFEELLIGGNTIDTDNSLIMRAKEDMVPWNELKPILKSLKEGVESGNNEKIRKLLIQLVPSFKPQCEIVDILFKKD
ncbi:nucleoside-diphosphate sugar epimerase/dehydratase [Methylophilaceae bacterium Uisw_099_01]